MRDKGIFLDLTPTAYNHFLLKIMEPRSSSRLHGVPLVPLPMQATTNSTTSWSSEC